MRRLLLPVRRSAPCDVRAALGDDVRTAVLARAGTRTLKFDAFVAAIAPRRPGPVAVELRWSAAGAREVRTRTVRVRLRRLPAPPLPRVLHLRVRRHPGGIVDVRWRTDVPGRNAYFMVFATRTRSLDADDAPAVATAAAGPTRWSFHVRVRGGALRPRRGDPAAGPQPRRARSRP